MKILPTFFLITFFLIPIVHAKKHVLLQWGDRYRFCADTSLIENSPSWEADQELPLKIKEVISIILKQYPNTSKEFIHRITLTQVRDATFKNKWYFNILFTDTSISTAKTVLVLMDGTIIEGEPIKK